ERAGAVGVGPPAGDRRGDEHPERERRELDARGDRVVALRALEVEDEHEHQREARKAVDERGRGGRGEEAVLEDGEVEQRSAAAFANRNAAPMPCAMRHRMSCVASAEKPAPSDMRAKTTKPATYAFLRPNRSDRRPAVNTSTVEAIMYARITHTSWSRLVCN